jgi:hypothetical protein
MKNKLAVETVMEIYRIMSEMFIFEMLIGSVDKLNYQIEVEEKKNLQQRCVFQEKDREGGRKNNEQLEEKSKKGNLIVKREEREREKEN